MVFALKGTNSENNNGRQRAMLQNDLTTYWSDCNSLFTMTDPDSDSDPIHVVGSWDSNLNVTRCSEKSCI